MSAKAGKDFLLKQGDGGVGVNAAVNATKTIQDLTFTANNTYIGTPGNGIQIQYSSGGTAGSEVVTVIGKNIDIKIQSGTSTATQVRAAFNAVAAATALASCAVTGTGGNAQTAPVTLGALSGGTDATSAEAFTTLGGLRTASIKMNAEEIDVTNIGSAQFKELLDGAGILNLSIAGAGVFTDDTTQATAMTDFLAQTLKNYMIIDFVSGNTFKGKFKIKSLERAGGYKDATTWQISLESSGAVTYTPHA
jgi:TP901-1 family phage major tail protein